jgi:hypothetical protein
MAAEKAITVRMVEILYFNDHTRKYARLKWENGSIHVDMWKSRQPETDYRHVQEFQDAKAIAEAWCDRP